MKSIEELADTITTTSIADLVPKVILDEVEEAARARRFGRNLIKINSDLVRTKGRSIVIGRRGTLTAASVSEATTLESSEITYTANTITPTKIGVAAFISEESIEGCELNLIKDVVTEAGIALAVKEDGDIMTALLDYSIDHSTFESAGTNSISLPLVYVEETESNFSKVDYYDGNIAATDACTITYWSSGHGTTYFTDSLDSADANTWATDAYKSIIKAVTAIRARKWAPKFIVIHPDVLSGILRSNMFIDASKYGAAEPIVNGEIGKLAGLKVLVTTQMPNGAALVLDPDRAAWMAVRRNLDMKRWDNPATDSVELYFYSEYGVSVTDKAALQVIVNLTEGSDNF